MDNSYFISHFLLVSLAWGIFGTLAMSLLMLGIDRAGLTKANMIEAIGSIFTKSEENAHLVGAIIHFASGVTFSIIYNLIFGFTNVTGFLLTTVVGIGIGFGHGFVMVFLLLVAVAEHHPLEKYREAGPYVAAAHLVGHIVYGAVVGAITGSSGLWVG